MFCDFIYIDSPSILPLGHPGLPNKNPHHYENPHYYQSPHDHPTLSARGCTAYREILYLSGIEIYI